MFEAPRVPRSLEALYGLPAHPYAGSTRGSLDGVRPGAWGPGLWANKMDADDAGRTELDYRELQHPLHLHRLPLASAPGRRHSSPVELPCQP